MKYFIIRTTPKGIHYRMYKCLSDYWTKDFTQCWQFSEQGAKKICDRENQRVKEACEQYGNKPTTHYNYVEVEKTFQLNYKELRENLKVSEGRTPNEEHYRKLDEIYLKDDIEQER